MPLSNRVGRAGGGEQEVLPGRLLFDFSNAVHRIMLKLHTHTQRYTHTSPASCKAGRSAWTFRPMTSSYCGSYHSGKNTCMPEFVPVI